MRDWNHKWLLHTKTNSLLYYNSITLHMCYIINSFHLCSQLLSLSHVDVCCLCAILFLDYCIQIIYKTGMHYLLAITKVFAIPYTPTPWKIVVNVTKAISISKHNKSSNIILTCTVTCVLLFQFHVVDTILNLNFWHE